jgi:hypothetical protein
MAFEKPNQNEYQSNLDQEQSEESTEKQEDAEKTSNDVEEIEQDIDEFREEAEQMLRSNKYLYESFSDSITPKLQFSNGVHIDFKTMTIHLDTEFFYKKGFSKKQMLWATYHELAHFKDLLSDPRRFMENFKHIRAKAEEYGEKIRKITGQPKREFTEEEKEKGKIDPADRQAYGSWHTFYNCLDDVYVNSLVERGVFSYSSEGRDHNEISNLYDNVLFKGTDYSNLPKSRQFSYAMLRKAMLPDQELTLSLEVEEILQREIKFMGKKMTVEQMIQMIQSKTRKGAKAGDRYFMIQKTLEPIFEELYEQDLEEWEKRREEKEEKEKDEQGEGSEQKQNGEEQGEQEQSGQSDGFEDADDSQESQDSETADDSENTERESEDNEQGEQSESGDPFDQEFDPENADQPKQTPNMPDFEVPKDLDDKDIDKIIDKIEDFKENPDQKPDEPTKEEIEAEQERKKEEKIKEWCKENGVDRETLRRFEQIQEEISPYLAQLSKVWDSIIYGKGLNFAREKEARSQGEINVSRTIKYFPDILAGRIKEVKPMDRKVMKELPANKPEEIRVRFVGDASESMSWDNGIKQDVLEKVYVLIMASLRDFETKLNRTRSQTNTKLSVKTQGWLFGNNAHKIKDFRKGRDYHSEYVQIIKQFEGLRQDFGGTHDNEVYEKISEELTKTDKTDMKSGKAMDLVLEVTDGVSSNEEGTTAAVENLEKAGMIIRAFQIGNVDSDDKAAFERVWNEKGQKRGHVVGSEVENLIPAITEALKQYMSNVRI